MDVGRDPNPPDTVTFRRFPDGFEIALLPPPRLKGTRKGLAWSIVAAGLIILGGFGLVAAFQRNSGSSSNFVLCVVIDVCILLSACAVILGQFNLKRESAVLEARDGLMTLVRSHGHVSRQFPLADISEVHVWPWDDGRWGLRIELKRGQRISTLDGRSKSELSWVAGLLRAALAPGRREAPQTDIPVVYRAGGHCLVCGSPMEERIVACSRCRTPHHEECWTWNGACSTYGCREIRFTRTA